MAKPRLLILIVAYNAEKNIEDVLVRVPAALVALCDVEVLVLDDSSVDATFAISRQLQQSGLIPFPVHVLYNPVNQGYGGNQKIGYHFAMSRHFDFVALLHGDGQYAPEYLPTLVQAALTGDVAAVFGSRMLTKGAARQGGMPLYKRVGNRVLSWTQNKLLQSALSEFHSGYRIYRVTALRAIPFDLNTNDFHFDTEIIVQLMLRGLKIVELPIPTYYGDEICRVNGIKYAVDVLRTVIVARLQQYGVLYDRKFDVSSAPAYESKTGFPSSHSLAVDVVRPQTRVIDLGCAAGHVAAALRWAKQCTVVGLDRAEPEPGRVDEFVRCDLNDGLPSSIDFARYDYVLILDVIEHLSSPEDFVSQLRDALGRSPTASVVVSTGNIGFIVNRLMHLFGQFNYGKRGILDLTHTRLFTFASFRRLFEQGGFTVSDTRGIPAPFRLALGDRKLARLAERINTLLIKISRGNFAYQIFMVVKPLPSLEYLLDEAHLESAKRTAALDGRASAR